MTVPANQSTQVDLRIGAVFVDNFEDTMTILCVLDQFVLIVLKIDRRLTFHSNRRQLNGTKLLPLFECLLAHAVAKIRLTIEHILEFFGNVRRQSRRLCEAFVETPPFDLGLNKISHRNVFFRRQPGPVETQIVQYVSENICITVDENPAILVLTKLNLAAKYFSEARFPNLR